MKNHQRHQPKSAAVQAKRAADQPKRAAIKTSEALIVGNYYSTSSTRKKPNTPSDPSDAHIREQAYKLYAESDHSDGHDIEHWVEATASLEANTLGASSTSRKPFSRHCRHSEFMIRNTQELYGFKLSAKDGEIGQVTDFYFEDKTWVVRYLVADTGSWLNGRKVLLAPHAFGWWDREEKVLHIELTRQQIEDSPSINSHLPVSRQYEIDYYNYYGWPIYWSGGEMWGLDSFPEVLPKAIETAQSQLQYQHRDDKHLQSSEAVQGYAIHASDGEIGEVSGFKVYDRSWAILQVAVETGHWYDGKEILISCSQIDRISYEDSQVFVNLTLADIRRTTEQHQVKAHT